MSAPKDQQGARELVRSIAKKHGYLAAEKFARIPDPELRREFEEAFLNKDLIIGSSVITYKQPVFFTRVVIMNANKCPSIQVGQKLILEQGPLRLRTATEC